MSYSLDSDLLATLKSIVDILKEHPDMLESPDMGFFRDYLKSLGAKVPTSTGGVGAGDSADNPSAANATAPEEPEEEEEPYPTIEDDGVIEGDRADPNQDMGDPDATVSDEDMEKSNELKGEAVAAFGEGNIEEAIVKYTEAIKLNPGSALLHAKRGQAYIRLKRPNACIRDCNRALQINPDSAVAYKFRGRAHRLLGHWEQAANDLRQACKIDFDEQADEWLKEVTPHARKIEEWRLRKKRRDDEREIKLRKQRAEERARAHAEAKSTPAGDAPTGGARAPGGAGGMPGGLGGLGGIPGLDKLLEDPEVMELFSDPEVAAVFAEVSQNPANLLKHQSNPKVAKLLAILQKKMGGMGGMGGGGMGGMPGMGGMGGMPGMGGFGGMPGMGGFGGMPGMGGMPGFGGFGGDADSSGPPPSNPKSSSDDLD